MNATLAPLPKFESRSKLSPKQQLVTNYLVHGLSNKEVARELCVSPRTVEDHRREIFRELSARNSIELPAPR
jgi:DNA-binding NarL/FixJ family response regulator